MKKANLLIIYCFIISSFSCYSQSTGTLTPTDPFATYPSPLQVGLAVGVNYNPNILYDYYISPVDNTLQRDPVSKNGFVGSVVIAYTPLMTFIKKDNPSVPFKAPGWFSFLSSFNLAQLNTSTGFNTKFSGGLGVGINIQNIFQIGLFVDFTETKILRKSYTDSLGKQLLVNNIPLVSLDKGDARFFKTDFTTSFSIKFIYNITRRNSDVKTGLNKEYSLQ